MMGWWDVSPFGKKARQLFTKCKVQKLLVRNITEQQKCHSVNLGRESSSAEREMHFFVERNSKPPGIYKRYILLLEPLSFGRALFLHALTKPKERGTSNLSFSYLFHRKQRIREFSVQETRKLPPKFALISSTKLRSMLNDLAGGAVDDLMAKGFSAAGVASIVSTASHHRNGVIPLRCQNTSPGATGHSGAFGP